MPFPHVGQQIVSVDALGKCEHCGEILSMEEMPSEAMFATWACPKCEKVLSSKTFGYEEGGTKVAWLNKQKEMVAERPTTDFELDELYVTTDDPSAGRLL